MSAAIAKNLMAEMKLLGMFAAYDQLRRPRATSRNDLSAALLLSQPVHPCSSNSVLANAAA